MILTSDWLWAGIALAVYLILTGLEILLNRFFRFNPVFAGAFNYFLAGVFVFFVPIFFTHRIPVVILCLVIALINLAGLKWFRRSDWFDGRRGLGPVYLPVISGFLIWFYFNSNPAVFQAAILAFTASDPLATLVGQSMGKIRSWFTLNRNKTLEGMITMMVMGYLALLLCGFAGLFPGLTYFDLFPIALLVAFIASLAEMILSQGLDNIFVPLGTAFLLDTLMQEPQLVIWLWMVLGLMVVAGVLSVLLRFLTADGAVAMILMGFFLLGIGGWGWVLPMLVFFLLSSLLSLASHRFRQEDQNDPSVKSGARDQFQVWANGGIPLLLFFLANYNLWPWIYVVYLAAIAAATADTWSTETGRWFSRNRPLDILTRQPVPAGQSGGVTLAGLAGGAAGSAVIAGLIFWQTDFYFETPVMLFFLILITGFSGTLVDSILGSRYQAVFSCTLVFNLEGAQ